MIVCRSVDVKLKTAFASGFIRPGISMTVNRVIFSGVTAKFGIDVGLKHNVSFGIVSKNETTAVGTNIIFSDRAVGFQAKYTRRLDEETKIKFRLSTGSIAAGTTHKISSNSQFSNLLEINAQSGVILYCHWKRMGSSFEVPIILNMQPDFTTALIGSIVPTAMAFLVRNFIIEPRRKRLKQE